MRLFRTAAALGLIMVLVACGVPPVRPDHLAESDKTRLGKVVVIVRHSDPIYEFEASTGGKGEGAAKGAGAGAAASIRCGILVIICLPIGAAVGAIAGASQATSADVLDSSSASLESEIRSLGVPQKLHDALVGYVGRTGAHASVLPLVAAMEAPDATPSYAEIASHADLVVEVRASRIKASTLGDKDLVVALMLSARVRIINTGNGQVLDDFVTGATPHGRKVNEWTERAAAGISESIAISLNEIAEAAIDESLLIYHPGKMELKPEPEPAPSQAPKPADAADAPQKKELVPGYALRAVYPPFRNKYYSDNRLNFGLLELFALADLQPTFEWEAFPRAYDIVPGSGAGQAHNLRYDFRLHQGFGIAYERTGLALPRHQVEKPLQPCNAYRWTTRATFELNGTPRVTEWTGGYNSIGGAVGPWEWRRGKRTSTMWLLPNATKYPIVTTPASNGGPCPRD